MAEEKKARGCLMPCIRCGEESPISVFMDDVDGDEAFHCANCEEDFGRGDVEAILAKWPAVLAWMDNFPFIKED